jgi:hypothetical protein
MTYSGALRMKENDGWLTRRERGLTNIDIDGLVNTREKMSRFKRQKKNINRIRYSQGDQMDLVDSMNG